MTAWLHWLLVYPLAVFGLLIVAALVFVLWEPVDKGAPYRYCGNCGKEAPYAARRTSLQGFIMCEACWAQAHPSQQPRGVEEMKL